MPVSDFRQSLSVALGLTAALLISSPLAAHAQQTAQDVMTVTPGFCTDGQIVVVDGQAECIIADSLNKLIEDFQNANLANDPISAGERGDDEALRRLPDVSLENARAVQEETTAFLSRHAQLATQPFSAEERLNYDLLGFVLRQRQRLAPFDGARIPFTNDSGFFNSLTYIARQTTFETVSDYEAYAARLTQLPRYFLQNRQNMQRGIETDMTAAAEIMPGILETVQTLAEGPAQSHSLYAPFKTFPDSVSDGDKKRLAALGEAAIKSAVLPAYRDLAKFLEKDYIPKARQVPGIGINEDARNYYRALTRYFTTLDLTPDEIHQMGLNEVARIRGEMNAIIKEVGFKGSFAEFLNDLRTNPKFYAKSERELLMTASYLAKKIDGKMPEYFGILPRLSYGVIPVPAEIAPNYTTGRYWGGNPEKGRAGNYVVNTYDLKSRPLYNLPALTAHEGVPGHHHQIALAQELENVPRFRQSLYPNAFGEGWGLYSEKLAGEMGIYETPYERFGQLTYEMWRACRLVVDTGLHWKGWSRDQAEACFLENSALAAHNIKTEVDRYISWPGQALAYKIGELKILELRERAKTALKSDFDIRRFHDAILEDGGVPLDMLEAKIDRWIGQEKIRLANESRAEQADLISGN
jgi:uncharacterized protein (DUF885 family)